MKQGGIRVEFVKIKLLSDFVDYYDHWFDLEGITFNRFSCSGMKRSEALKYLGSLGLRVPIFGRVKDLPRLIDNYPQVADVVIYLDETAHRGEGKIKMPLMEALEKYPDHLATEYIQVLPAFAGYSWRYLQVGDKRFWLQYFSSNDWRSNCGQVEIKILSKEKDGYHPTIKYPLFAIDFLPAGHLYAVDFNIAPQLNGTGIEDILSSREAAEAIKKAVVHFL
jgi:hypothetical protein